MSILAHLPRISGLKNQDELVELVKAAKDDGHDVIAPTHVIWKDGKIVGCFSVGSIPTVLVWMHSKEMGPRDTLNMINSMEGSLQLQGNTDVFVPCATDSPFFKVMEELGYKKSFDLFHKKL